NLELHTLAVHDDLTGLYNSRHIRRSLRSWMEIQDGSLLPVSLVMFDVDHFKQVDDTYGHAVGDLVLKELGSLIRSHLRAQDIGGRCGGEEFAVLLPRTELNQAEVVAERLRAAVEELTILSKGQKLKITVSLGVATAPLHGKSADDLFEAADQSLYLSKRSGRNKVSTAAELEQFNDDRRSAS
ncbi:MAG: GGDEF domain-containing protein, partial [Bdellovibrionales bacterium]|nr:GGDEF domain-containing protein [Bdellovibrionales bacterium]